MLKRQATPNAGSPISPVGHSPLTSRSPFRGALLVASVGLAFGWSAPAMAQSVSDPAAGQPAANSPAAPTAELSSPMPTEAAPSANSAGQSSSTVPEVTAQGGATATQEPATQDGTAPTATASAGNAQSPFPTGSCFTPPAGVLPSEVDAFLADPQDVFAQGNGSALLVSNRVRALAGSDARTIEPLITLSQSVGGDRAAAIGAGLGRAAFGCARLNPDFAAYIQTKVAERGAAPLMTAFVAASNDMQVAALGAAGGASGGGPAAGLSGGGDAGPFSAGLGGDETVPQTGTEPTGRSGSRFIIGDDDDGDGDRTTIINIITPPNNGNNCDTSVSPSCVN